MKKIMICGATALMLIACGSENNFDATGTFEATEVVISSEVAGRIVEFDVQEGDMVTADAVIGLIDTMQLHLQRKQLVAQQSALLSSRPDIQTQVSAIREQIAKWQTERTRVSNLLKDGAATTKQLDDIDAQLSILNGQLDATLSTLNNSTASINDNVAALEAGIAQIDDRLAKCRIASPISGTVLAKYSEEGELAAVGRPMIKVADMGNIYLRAYFTSDQLSSIKLGDEVKVVADFGADEQIEYGGKITWIASESEFTPKNIQTKDSRANLVYAVKIAVKNDGRLKLGLSGKVHL